uniref:Short-chain dehydrogenase/reductase n=1 Tax=Micromonospora inyonensis TaxID=47866 RepID=A0A059P1A6_9ACTN|nr:short-chain dehydrogenase/reductase [Micromonospora inyonensis]
MTVPQRVAIVTGGSQGIGRQIVKRLAADGYAVVLNYATSKVEAEQTVAEIAAAGGDAVAVQADVADEFAVARLFDTAEQTYGGIDVVVNSAGNVVHAPIVELDLADLDRVHRTNVRGTFVVDQQAARRVRARRRDHQHLQYDAQAVPAHLLRLCRQQGRGGRDHPDPGPGAGGTRHHRERRRTRGHRHRPFPRRQGRAGRRPDGGDVADEPARRAGRHRRRGGLPRQSGRAVDQRPGAVRQRRCRLTLDLSLGGSSRDVLSGSAAVPSPSPPAPRSVTPTARTATGTATRSTSP